MVKDRLTVKLTVINLADMFIQTNYWDSLFKGHSPFRQPEVKCNAADNSCNHNLPLLYIHHPWLSWV